MEQNVAPDPLYIRLLGADAVVPDSYQLTDLVQQPRRFPVLRITRHKNLYVHPVTCQIDAGNDAALFCPPDGVGAVVFPRELPNKVR